jgi:hypothetical protein
VLTVCVLGCNKYGRQQLKCSVRRQLVQRNTHINIGCMYCLHTLIRAVVTLWILTCTVYTVFRKLRLNTDQALWQPDGKKGDVYKAAFPRLVYCRHACYMARTVHLCEHRTPVPFLPTVGTCPSSQRTRKFIAVFTTARHLSPPEPDESSPRCNNRYL